MEKMFSVLLKSWMARATLGVPLAVLGLASPAAADRPGDDAATCAPGVGFLGFSDALDKATFEGLSVSELSGVTYDSQRGLYHAVADRAGSIPAHYFSIHISVGSHSMGEASVVDLLLLRDDQGVQYNGFNLDAEGIALSKQDELWIASEGGSASGQQPEIRRFNLNGDELESLPVDSRFYLKPVGGSSGNLAFESLSLSPDGHHLFTATEGALAQDGQTADLRNRIRIVHYSDLGGGGFREVGQYYYLGEPGRDAKDLGVAEVIALSGTDLLVLERGFKVGEGNTARIFRASVKDATDVTGEASLAESSVAPVKKELLVDLAKCPSKGAEEKQPQPTPLMDNFEAMTLGPRLPGGRRALILLSDDNTSNTQTTRVLGLSIPIADLVGNDDNRGE